jgi:hypothetical protein
VAHVPSRKKCGILPPREALTSVSQRTALSFDAELTTAEITQT